MAVWHKHELSVDLETIEYHITDLSGEICIGTSKTESYVFLIMFDACGYQTSSIHPLLYRSTLVVHNLHVHRQSRP